jgi:hypothetical protein
MTSISTYKLDAAFANLKEFDHCTKLGDFIEVILWHNGEGFDAHLSGHCDQFSKMTWGKFRALKKLIKGLDK